MNANVILIDICLKSSDGKYVFQKSVENNYYPRYSNERLAFNMWEIDSSDYKENVTKTIKNNIAKLVREKYFCDQKHNYSFKNLISKKARAAHDTKKTVASVTRKKENDFCCYNCGLIWKYVLKMRRRYAKVFSHSCSRTRLER